MFLGSASGIVPLSVSKNNMFVTHSVPFEYRCKSNLNLDSLFEVCGPDSDWLALNDREFRFRLLTRLDLMQSHLLSFVSTGTGPFKSTTTSSANDVVSRWLCNFCSAEDFRMSFSGQMPDKL